MVEVAAPILEGKGGGAVRLASQAADEGGSCISPYTWGQGTSCRPGIKKQGETGRKQRSHMTGRGAQRDREQERGPWTCEDCQDLQVKVAGTGCPPVPQTVTARQCPWGDQPSWVPAKPCCPTAGTDGPCEIRVHWASGFPGWAISVACLGSDRGRPPWRLASGRLSAHRCPLHRNSYLWELIGVPWPPRMQIVQEAPGCTPALTRVQVLISGRPYFSVSEMGMMILALRGGQAPPGGITKAGTHKPAANSRVRWRVCTRLCHFPAGDLGQAPWLLCGPLPGIDFSDTLPTAAR